MSFFEMGYDVSVLIEEIKKRPLLYEQSFSNNNDDLKQKLWEEVYTIVLPQWNQLNDAQRFWKADELQDRWRRLRKKFQKMHRRSTHKKSFKYLDQLAFLLPIKENQKLTIKSVNNNNLLTECQPEPPQTDLDTLPDIPDLSSASYTPGVGYVLDTFSLSEIEDAKSNPIDQNESSCDIQINDNNNLSADLNGNDKEQSSEEEEEENNAEIDKDPDKDEDFLLSLLPAFEEFDSLTKLEVKSDILRIITRKLKQNMQNIEST